MKKILIIILVLTSLLIITFLMLNRMGSFLDKSSLDICQYVKAKENIADDYGCKTNVDNQTKKAEVLFKRSNSKGIPDILIYYVSEKGIIDGPNIAN